MGLSQKRKGERGERALAKVLQEKGFEQAHRGYVQFNQADVYGLPGIHIEVKSYKDMTEGKLKKAMEQSVAEAKKKDGGIPTVFHKVDYGKWFVTMRDFDFMEFFIYASPYTWNYLEINNQMVTTLLDEWIERYKGVTDER